MLEIIKLKYIKPLPNPQHKFKAYTVFIVFTYTLGFHLSITHLVL